MVHFCNILHTRSLLKLFFSLSISTFKTFHFRFPTPMTISNRWWLSTLFSPRPQHNSSMNLGTSRETWLFFYSPPLETKHISYGWRQALRQLASKKQHFSKLNFPMAFRTRSVLIWKSEIFSRQGNCFFTSWKKIYKVFKFHLGIIFIRSYLLKRY